MPAMRSFLCSFFLLAVLESRICALPSAHTVISSSSFRRETFRIVHFVAMTGSAEVPDIPSLVVVEATGRRVKVESTEGSFFTGNLVNFDPRSGNVELADVKHQAKDSSLSVCERIVVKGDRVRMIHLPIELQKAPMLDWHNDSLQQVLKKALKPKKRAVKRATKKDNQNLKRKEEKKLRKLR